MNLTVAFRRRASVAVEPTSPTLAARLLTLSVGPRVQGALPREAPTSPWVRRSREGALSVTAPRGSSPRPAAFEPVRIHSDAECPDQFECRGVHIVSRSDDPSIQHEAVTR